jgi:hypothetical protein
MDAVINLTFFNQILILMDVKPFQHISTCFEKAGTAQSNSLSDSGGKNVLFV